MKIISFDMDGTLVDENFDQTLWYTVIPELYAARHKMTFEEALTRVRRTYDEVGSHSLDYYSPEFWFKRFDLQKDFKAAIHELRHLVKVFPDAMPALRMLKGQRKIIVSNADRHFVELKLKADHMDTFFDRIYSVTSDFKIVKKDEKVFIRICDDLGIKPSELWHVGDNWKFDYEAARKAEVNAFFLDRTGEKKGEGIVHSLLEFAEKVSP